MSETPKVATTEEKERDIRNAEQEIERVLNVELTNLANWHNLELHYAEIEYSDGRATVNLRFI